jgi:hypothetical protein
MQVDPLIKTVTTQLVLVILQHFSTLPGLTNDRERKRKRALTRTPYPCPKSVQGDRVFVLPVQLWSTRSGTGKCTFTFTIRDLFSYL